MIRTYVHRMAERSIYIEREIANTKRSRERERKTPRSCEDGKGARIDIPKKLETPKDITEI